MVSSFHWRKDGATSRAELLLKYPQNCNCSWFLRLSGNTPPSPSSSWISRGADNTMMKCSLISLSRVRGTFHSLNISTLASSTKFTPVVDWSHSSHMNTKKNTRQFLHVVGGITNAIEINIGEIIWLIDTSRLTNVRCDLCENIVETITKKKSEEKNLNDLTFQF